MDLSDEFPLQAGLCYLNHAAVAPWPRRAAEAAAAFAHENQTMGATNYPQWMAIDQRLRRHLAALIGASTEDISLVKNTSEALSFIAYGLTWHEGDEVVITNQEFPSNRIVWESLQPQGVTVIEANVDVAAQAEDAIIAALTPATRLVSVSSVQYGTGLRLDLARIGAACQQRGVMFCVDAIQSLGAAPFDVDVIGADFVAADGHKWMLGAEGLGVLYVRANLRPHLRLHEFGWHMLQHRGDYQRREWQPAPDGKRFECGSPNMLGAVVLERSLSLLLDVELSKVEQALHERVEHLWAMLTCLSDRIQIITPSAREQRLGILSFRVAGADHDSLHRELMRQQVICAARGGGIRFSPHFYTPLSVLETAVERLSIALKGA